MNLEKHILTLLLRHDCVSVPGFGAFVARRSNSVYQEEISVISPPFKELIFNASLTENDGLLIQQLLTAENLTYDAAEEKLKSAVNFWKNHLNSNTELNLSGLGKLIKDQNNQLVFESQHRNLLLESYGLDDIKLKRILQTEEQTGSSTIWWKTAALVPLLVGGFLYFAKPQPVSDFVNQQWSGFVSPVMNPNTQAVKAVESSVKIISENTRSNYQEIKDEQTVHNHQVIAGAFKKQDEIEPFVQRLREKGYEQARFTQKKGSYYFVAFKTFEQKEQAQQYINSIQGEMPDAWILSLKD